MSAVAHERRFGVEIECGYRAPQDRDGYSYDGYTVVHEAMRKSKRFTLRPLNSYAPSRHHAYSVSRDGSGVEVRTPILKGKHGFEELRRIFFFLNEMGCYVTERDGMHVHHDAPELVKNPILTRNLVKGWVANREAICEMVTPYRARNMGPWGTEQLKKLDALSRGQTHMTDSYGYRYPVEFGRNELNIASLNEHGTVEFRLHEGTLDINEAIAWIKFGQRFMDSVLHRARPLRKGNRAQLLNRIRLSKTEQAKLDAKRGRLYGAA